MSALRVAVIDYGAGNLHSVEGSLGRAARDLGVELVVRVVSLPGDAADADAVVLPGVGAFDAAMAKLREQGFIDAIADFAATGRPLLGICAGMQVLYERGAEGGDTAGLGLLAGTVRALPDDVKRPHMGWNRILPQPAESWVGEPTHPYYAYFAHSYAVIDDDAHAAATTRYGPVTMISACRRENVHGVQFHPERSGRTGLALLRRILASAAGLPAEAAAR